jgi:hypothetical protein
VKQIDVPALEPEYRQLPGELAICVAELSAAALERANPTGKVLVVERQFEATVRQVHGQFVTNLETHMLEQIFRQYDPGRTADFPDF